LILDGDEHLYPSIQVTGHPVGTTDQEQLISAAVEINQPGML
jgi:hypothetical protein